MISENFSRWFDAIPLQKIKSNAVYDDLIDALITRFGVPEYIHSDYGIKLTSKFYTYICKNLGMEPIYSFIIHSVMMKLSKLLCFHYFVMMKLSKNTRKRLSKIFRRKSNSVV